MDKSKNKITTTKPEHQDEFMPGVTDEFNPDNLKGLSRRRFLALVGASSAFVATACTNYKDKGEIVPYNKKPEEVYIGGTNYYASTCTACSLSCGTLIKTRDGRPIKITGNPEHPVNQGKICSIGEANIMNLYDPQRIQGPLNIKGSNLLLFKDDVTKDTWINIDKEVIEALKKAVADNKEIAVIANPVHSPSQAKLFEDFKIKYPTTKIYSYKLFDNKTKLSAWKKCYGDFALPIIKWEEAGVIVALDADILGNEGQFMETLREFANKRNADDIKNFCKLYSIEAGMSLTGMNADCRFRLRPEKQLDFVLALLNEIVVARKSIFNIPSGMLDAIRSASLDKFAKENNLSVKKLKNLSKDLIDNKGKSIVYSGNKLDESLHIAVNLLNEILENNKLYDSEKSNVNFIPLSETEEIDKLVAAMNSKKVDIVIHYDTNPVYHFPKELKYDSALKNLKKVITMTDSKNETSVLSKLTLPINHDLESWGDFKTRTGVMSLQQPVIAPIYNTRQKEAILLNWMSDTPDKYSEEIYHQYIMNLWEKEIYPKVKSSLDFKTFWFSALHDGVISLDESSQSIGKFSYNGELKTSEAKDFTLILNKSYFLGDGRFANNGWLQEIPHPITKVTWDNYASISEGSAKELNLKMEDKVEVKLNGKSFVLPLMIQPGMADKVISVELGYGRWQAGDVGNQVGADASIFMGRNGLSPWIYSGATISKASGKYVLAMTQEHHAITEPKVKDFHLKRKIIIEGTVDEYKKNPLFMKEGIEEEIPSIIAAHPYTNVKWAMAIDLNKCTGCSQCVASCNVENNVPIVGRDQVLVGREMHWVRIDRYYSGSNDEPVISNQPIMCNHCDNAPCENVCPVVATNHSPDGLNQMVYNRCVGTRYCSNNCPFKVRRFNFFDFRDRLADGYYNNDSVSLMHNPEVTVRSRGVMEKCTFCIQRIMEARQNATKEGRQLVGSDVKTACQVSCPTNAIVFGDMNNPDSEISKLRKHNLAYFVLAELNIKPNVTYLAKLRNTNPEEV